MKLAVIYDTKTGNTKKAAKWIVEGMKKAGDVEAKAFSLEDVDYTFVSQAKGLVLGCPVYGALMTPAMRTWLMESGMKLKVAGKLGGAFATAQFTHGGADLVIQSLLTGEIAMGMMAYSGGGAYGLPVIHLGPVGINDNLESHNKMENYRDNFRIYGERFAAKALELFPEKN